MKLRDTLLIAAAVGCFLLWILEFRRSSFIDSYWLLLASLGFLLAFQYFRIKRREAERLLSPTIRQMAQDRRAKDGVRPSDRPDGRTPADTVRPTGEQPAAVPPRGIRPSASGKKKK